MSSIEFIDYDKPRREDGPFLMTVRVWDLNDLEGTEPEQEYDLDYNDPGHRHKLAKTCIWAWNNGRSVETCAAKDKEL